MITQENWTHSYYNSPKLRAFISIGAEPTLPKNSIFYIMNLTDHEHKEIFLKDFPTLNQAVREVNQKYNHWQFVDSMKKNDSDSGCGSCTAH